MHPQHATEVLEVGQQKEQVRTQGTGGKVVPPRAPDLGQSLRLGRIERELRRDVSVRDPHAWPALRPPCGCTNPACDHPPNDGRREPDLRDARWPCTASGVKAFSGTLPCPVTFPELACVSPSRAPPRPAPWALDFVPGYHGLVAPAGALGSAVVGGSFEIHFQAIRSGWSGITLRGVGGTTVGRRGSAGHGPSGAGGEVRRIDHDLDEDGVALGAGRLTDPGCRTRPTQTEPEAPDQTLIFQ